MLQLLQINDKEQGIAARSDIIGVIDQIAGGLI